MQHSLLPRELPAVRGSRRRPRLRVVGARRRRGDVYDFLTLDDGRLAIILGDVTGQGIQAAADMAMAKFIFRALARDASRAGATSSRARTRSSSTRSAWGSSSPCSMRCVDPKAAHDRRARARAIPPRGSSIPTEPSLPLAGHGLALGIEPRPGVRGPSRPCFEPGVSVVLYTDGVVEARRDGELYGEERLDELLGRRQRLAPPGAGGGDPGGLPSLRRRRARRRLRGRLSTSHRLWRGERHRAPRPLAQAREPGPSRRCSSSWPAAGRWRPRSRPRACSRPTSAARRSSGRTSSASSSPRSPSATGSAASWPTAVPSRDSSARSSSSAAALHRHASLSSRGRSSTSPSAAWTRSPPARWSARSSPPSRSSPSRSRCSGVVSPFAIRLALARRRRGGTVAGRLYALSTVGSIARYVRSALVTIPLVGTQRTMLGSAALLVLAGALLLGNAAGSSRPLRSQPCSRSLPGRSRPRPGSCTRPSRAYQYVQVSEQTDGSRALNLNEGVAVHSLWRSAHRAHRWRVGHVPRRAAASRHAGGADARDRQRGRDDRTRLWEALPGRRDRRRRDRPRGDARSGRRFFGLGDNPKLHVITTTTRVRSCSARTSATTSSSLTPTASPTSPSTSRRRSSSARTRPSAPGGHGRAQRRRGSRRPPARPGDRQDRLAAFPEAWRWKPLRFNELVLGLRRARLPRGSSRDGRSPSAVACSAVSSRAGSRARTRGRAPAHRRPRPGRVVHRPDDPRLHRSGGRRAGRGLLPTAP